MANKESGEAPAARPPKEKTAAQEAQKAKGAGKKKAAEPTGPAPKYKREQPPRLRRQYDDAVRGAMRGLATEQRPSNTSRRWRSSNGFRAPPRRRSSSRPRACMTSAKCCR